MITLHDTTNVWGYFKEESIRYKYEKHCAGDSYLQLNWFKIIMNDFEKKKMFGSRSSRGSNRTKLSALPAVHKYVVEFLFYRVEFFCDLSLVRLEPQQISF